MSVSFTITLPQRPPCSHSSNHEGPKEEMKELIALPHIDEENYCQEFANKFANLCVKDQHKNALRTEAVTYLAKSSFAWLIKLQDRHRDNGMFHKNNRVIPLCAFMKNHCVFHTPLILGRGQFKDVLEGIHVEMQSDPSNIYVKVTSIALFHFHKITNEEIKRKKEIDETVALLGSSHILGASIIDFVTPCGFFAAYEKGKCDLSPEMLYLRLTFNETFRVLKGIAKALDILHQNGLIHRDVKPENMLAAMDGHGILIDKDFIVRENEPHHVCLTKIYGPPELAQPTPMFALDENEDMEYWKDNSQTTYGDQWAFGLSIYEIVRQNLGVPIFQGISTDHQLNRQLNQLKFMDEAAFSNNLFSDWQPLGQRDSRIQALIARLIVINPLLRATATETIVAIRDVYKFPLSSTSSTS